MACARASGPVWFPGLRQVSRAVEEQQLTAGDDGSGPLTPFPRLAAILPAVDGQHGAGHPGQDRLGLLTAGRRERRVPEQQVRLGAGLHDPAHAVLVLLAGVRLGQQFGEEELGEPAPVPQPAMPGVPGPAFVGPGIGVEVVDLAPGQRRREEGHPGRDVHDAEHPVRVQGRGQERRPRAAAYPDEYRAVDACGVHDRDGVGHELGVGVGGGRLRPVRPAVPSRIDGDHPRRPGQVRHLGLPGPRVDQRIGRGEHQGGLTRAEHLVGDLDAIPLDEALGVRISRPHVPSSPVFLFLTRPVAAGLQRHCNPSAQSGP